VDLEGAADAEPPSQGPSIAYEEAMAHARDRIAFEPGGRVTVGFRPRASDRWPVDGRAPVALPGGRATGRQMAAGAQGSRWAATGTPAPRTGDEHAGGRGKGASPGPPTDAPANRAVLAARALSSVTPAATADVEPSASASLRRQVFGFLPTELAAPMTRSTTACCPRSPTSRSAPTRGNLRKRDADGSRTIGWSGWTSLDHDVGHPKAHRRGTRVVLTISVFRLDHQPGPKPAGAAGQPGARLRLARQAVAAVRDRGADGVNLDFEPLASGYAKDSSSLCCGRCAQLNDVRRGYQLTYDDRPHLQLPLEASVGRGAADAIRDGLRVPHRLVVGRRLHRSAGRTTYDVADTVRAYTARVSPSRLILGVPWYGRAWSTASDGVRSRNISGTRYGHSTSVTYETVARLAREHGRRYDAAERSPYVVYWRRNCTNAYGCVTSWRQVYYDDAASMKLRYGLVNDYRLRGAGIWALGYEGGRAEPYRALAESFLVDVAAPRAGVRMLAPTQLDEGFVVAWAARDTTAVAAYDVQVSVDGGAWRQWRTRTRATSDVWLGGDGHGYAFRVRAVDTRGNVGGWTVGSRWDPTPPLAAGGFGRVVRDGLAYRSGPDKSALRLGTLRAGTIVALTRGPVSRDGYAWYEVTEPVREWGPVSFVERGVWITVRSSTRTYVRAAPRPATRSSGRGSGAWTSAAAHPAPSGRARPGRAAGLLARRRRLGGRAAAALDERADDGGADARVYRTDGTLVGSRRVSDARAGAQAWDGTGRSAAAGSAPAAHPAAQGATPAADLPRALGPASHAGQVAACKVTVDTVDPTITSASVSGAVVSP
jgi:hypothetical protein